MPFLDRYHCDRGPSPADHAHDCPRWCAFGHPGTPHRPPYTARATTIVPPPKFAMWPPPRPHAYASTSEFGLDARHICMICGRHRDATIHLAILGAD